MKLLHQSQRRWTQCACDSKGGFGETKQQLKRSGRTARGRKDAVSRPIRRIQASTADVALKEEEGAGFSGTSRLASVFVAGSTGRTGQRTVKELLGAGFNVTAGARSESSFSEKFSGLSEEQRNSLTWRSFDITQPTTTLADAIGEAEVVVCCVGAPENEFNPANPKLIDGEGVTKLVEAAKTKDKVKHFILVTSLGTGRFGWPASVLNLFFNILDWKRKSEEALVESGIPFTIIRPGGMERPTDDYYKTHNIILGEADTRFGGQVSRLQVSWLIREALLNREVSQNKILEIVAEEDAPEKPLDELMGKISTLGPLMEGSPAWYTQKYKYKRDLQELFFGIMGFSGSAPELINGRMAMLGFLAMLGYEFIAKQSLGAQLQDVSTLASTLGLMAIVITGSMIPLIKNASPKDAQVPGLSASAEMLNGRIAMLAFAYLSWKETTTDDLSTDIVKSAFSSLPHLGQFKLSVLGFLAILGLVGVTSSLLPFQFFKEEEH